MLRCCIGIRRQSMVSCLGSPSYGLDVLCVSAEKLKGQLPTPVLVLLSLQFSFLLSSLLWPTYFLFYYIFVSDLLLHILFYYVFYLHKISLALLLTISFIYIGLGLLLIRYVSVLPGFSFWFTVSRSVLCVQFM